MASVVLPAPVRSEKRLLKKVEQNAGFEWVVCCGRAGEVRYSAGKVKEEEEEHDGKWKELKVIEAEVDDGDAY